MTLQPGYRMALAARFHLDAAWADRISVGAGLREEDGGFFPIGPWRPPTGDELTLLVAGADEAAAGAVLLFQLPEHLRDEWWGLLDAAAETDGPVRNFDAYAAKVHEFLEFKGLDPSGPTQMEAVVTSAGQRSIRHDPATGQPAGLGPTVAVWAPYPPVAGGTVPRLHALVNLGDEPTGVVLINLSPAGLAAGQARPGSGPATVGELAQRFLGERPDYPPVRIRLGPGEGVGLPATGLILDGDPTAKQEPDILLLISAGQ
jgi:hypothetical protein